MKTHFPFTHPPAPEPRGPNDARPPATERVSYTIPWLRFLTGLALTIAWVAPLTYIAGRMLWPHVPEGPRDAHEFVAVAYSGISEKTNEVSPELFREQIMALKRRGYVPITLEEARDLLKNGKPVPRKAILLTMDHSRKTSYYLTKSFLRRVGWNAVMFLSTRPIEQGDPAALLWPYVRSLVRSRSWEIGAQSENGYQKIASDPFGGTGHFMTSRMWLPAKKRYETFDEMAQRVEEDHRRCIATIQQNCARRPIAYAYPYGDFGQYQRKQQITKRTNLALAGRYYDLAFLTGNFALNTANSDPRRLNRLLVRPEWTTQELVQRLERSWPQDQKRVFTNVTDAASSWVVDWGSMKVEAARLVLQSNESAPKPEAEGAESSEPPEGSKEWLVLQATEKITGARMWMSGSDDRKDLYWRIPFRLINGQMGAFVRGTPDEEQYVYLGIDTGGNVWLRQKHAGLETFTLASTKTRLSFQQDNVLEIYVRGVQFGAILNGVPLFSEGLTLRGAPEPGMIGISVWDTQSGRARLEIGNVVISPQEPTLVAWTEDDQYAPFCTRWIHRNGFRISHLSPSWLTVSSGGSLTQMKQDHTLVPLLARMYKLKDLPRVQILWDRWTTALSPAQLARSVQDIQADGAFVDFSGMDIAPLSALTTWLQQTLDVFADKGLQLAVRMPRLLEDPAVLQPVIAALPGLQLAVAPDSPVRDGVPGAEHDPMVAETMPQPESPGDIPFVHQIDDSGGPRELSVPERIRSLQEEGKAALLENKFQEAIALWTKWHELDPSDAAPLMLMGDVYVRMGDVNRALELYDQSLQLDPSRISLAMRRATLLESQDRGDEALKQINLYAQLFPESSEVMIAQIEWLTRHNRDQEARELIEHALEMKPEDFDVLINAIRLAPTPKDRRERFSQLKALCEKPEMQLEFGEAIEKYDLLAFPDAYQLMPVIESIATNSANPQVAALFQQFRRLDHPVTDTFAVGRLSDAWALDGGDAVSDGHSILRIEAGASRREVACRLRGTEMMENGFIEADLASRTSEFWLMACRGSDHFVRFGIDASSKLFLQVWKNGRRMANQSRFLSATSAKSIRLRLVVRGNGAIAYVDGKPAFDSPVTIPRDLGHGAWGFTMFDPDPGHCVVRLGSLEAGPLPLVIGALPTPPPPGSGPDPAIDALKGLVLDLTVLAPRWFTWQANGMLARQHPEQEEMVSIMARFYGLKLMPIIDMAGRDTIDLHMLTQLAADNRIDGFILDLPGMPPEQWMQSAAEALERDPFDLLLITPGPDLDAPSVVRALGPIANALGAQGPAPALYTSYLSPDEVAKGVTRSYDRNTLLLVLQSPPEPEPAARTAGVQNQPAEPADAEDAAAEDDSGSGVVAGHPTAIGE